MKLLRNAKNDSSFTRPRGRRVHEFAERLISFKNASQNTVEKYDTICGMLSATDVCLNAFYASIWLPYLYKTLHF